MPKLLPLDQIRSMAPEAHARIEEMVELVRETVDPALLELARLRMAALLACDEELAARTPGTGLSPEKLAALEGYATSPLFAAGERACLELAEQYVLDVAGTTDAQVAAALDHLGPQALFEYTSALYALDATMRLRVGLGRVFA